MLAKFLDLELIKVDEEVSNWKEAIMVAGDLLEQGGRVEEKYKLSMLGKIKEHGPYIVISPGLAIPHARPEDGVLANGVSILVLKNPVQFGHPEYDPVDVIVSFAGVDDKAHVNLMNQIAQFLDYEHNLEQLRSALNREEVLALINQKNKS